MYCSYPISSRRFFTAPTKGVCVWATAPPVASLLQQQHAATSLTQDRSTHPEAATPSLRYVQVPFLHVVQYFSPYLIKVIMNAQSSFESLLTLQLVTSASITLSSLSGHLRVISLLCRPLWTQHGHCQAWCGSFITSSLPGLAGECSALLTAR